MLVRTTEDELRQEVGEPFEDLGEQFLHEGEKKDEREKANIARKLFRYTRKGVGNELWVLAFIASLLSTPKICLKLDLACRSMLWKTQVLKWSAISPTKLLRTDLITG